MSCGGAAGGLTGLVGKGIAMDTRAGAEIHKLINFVGFRTEAAAVGIMQLTAELVRAGVIDDGAMSRIKAAIVNELELTRPGRVSEEEFKQVTHKRLDRLFSGEAAKTGPS
jgi:hypothetical protein